MPKNIDKELEFAILAMPVKEKDKLLLKLIAKNEILIEQLRFQLMEDKSDLDFKRKELKEMFLKVSKMTHNTPGWMMMDMRDLNGRISKHVKITKDKYGEVELTLYLLKVFYQNQGQFLEKLDRRNDTLSDYVSKRMDFLLKKLKAFNSDYYIEFYDDINYVLEKFYAGSVAIYAKNLEIPKRWEF